jgi:hypothetical protein
MTSVFTIDVHHFIHFASPEIESRVTELEVALDQHEEGNEIMFEDLRASVLANKNASDAMQVVLNDVRDRLAAIETAGMTPAAAAQLAGIITGIDEETADIVADTLAGTPSEEPPVTEDPPVVEDPVEPAPEQPVEDPNAPPAEMEPE